jgi:RNA polymerase sigma factor (sigma-70 family)
VSATATGSHEDGIGTRPRRVPARLLRLASDERLVELLRGGSDAAFEALYARHHRGVLSFCRHMLGSVEEAEDAVQHTFLAAYRDLVGSSKEIRWRPWLYAIARNRCITVLRARHERVEALAEPATEQLSAEVERRWELRALLSDLAELPDDQRAALVLAELGDLSHDEIGQALGCPREKVKGLVFQARTSLIASRESREAPCSEIREQLANLRGSSLRRTLLRRHLRECTGCREFRDQVQAQRRELALILPVAPSLGLQAAVLGGGGAAATSSIVAKTAVVLALAGGGAAAIETVHEASDRPAAGRGPRAPAAGAAGAPSAVPVAAPSARVPMAHAPGRSPRAHGPTAGKSRPAKSRGPRRDRPERAAPGHAKKSGGFVPPGQAKKSDGFVPPGQAKKSGGFVPPGQAKKPDKADKPKKAVPPGQAKKPDKPAPPAQQPDDNPAPPAAPPVQLPDEAAPRVEPGDLVPPDAADKVVPPGKPKKQQ